MSEDTTLSLLLEALELLNDRPNFGLRRAPRTTSYKLAARIDRHLAARAAAAPDSITLLETRTNWAQVGVAVDPGETETRAYPNGRWVRAWVPLVCDIGPRDRLIPMIAPAAYRAAVMALPDRLREPFWLHRVDGLSYADVARRLQIPAAEVESRVADALATLMIALHSERQL